MFNIFDKLHDSRLLLDYSVRKNITFKNEYDNVVILNDYSGYPDVRIKRLEKFSYLCDRNVIYSACSSNVSSLKILCLSSSGIPYEDNRVLDFANAFFDVILITNNVGQDFGGYFSGMDFIKYNKIHSSTITLLNTSQFYSNNHISSLIEISLPLNCFLGLSFGIGPRFKFIKFLHIQSYFLKFHFNDAFKVFDTLIPDRRFYCSKYNIIEHGEVKLSKLCMNNNLTPLIAFKGKLIKLDYKTSIMHEDFRANIFTDGAQYLTLT